MKKGLFALLALFVLLVAIFWFHTPDEMPQVIVEEHDIPTVSQSVTEKRPTLSTKKNPLPMVERLADDPFDAESIPLIDPYAIKIKPFSILNQLAAIIRVPESVKPLIDSGDILSAAAILKGQTDNPDAVMSLILLQGGCDITSMYADAKPLETSQLDEQKFSDYFSEDEQQFLIDASLSIRQQYQQTKQQCHELKEVSPINQKEIEAQLAANLQGPLARLIVEDDKLSKAEGIELAEQFHQLESSPRSETVLGLLYLESDNEEDLRAGIDVLSHSSEATPLKFLRIADCLKNKCSAFKEQVQPSDYWYQEAAKFGDERAIRRTFDHLVNTQQVAEEYTWAQFQIALLRQGCTQSPQRYVHDFRDVRNRVDSLTPVLTEEQIQSAKEAAGDLYDANKERIRSYLGCELYY